MNFKFQLSDFRLACRVRVIAMMTCAFALTACDRERPAAANPSPNRSIAQSFAIPERGIYAGAYIDWGDKEDGVTLEKIEGFEDLVGKKQAIVASSSYWGEQSFPDANVRMIVRHGSIPLLYWSPWDKPYVEGRGPDKYSLTSIIAGEHDAYIDLWADHARETGAPIIVSFANEMNGSWFPWSGVHYGGGKLLSVDPAHDQQPAVYHYEGPETFVKAYRHVVDRVRARGAKNVRWVFHAMDFSDPNEHWNLVAQYYPGPDYCDWLGLSVYGSQFPADAEWALFRPLLDWPYTELAELDPRKPIMLCEWGVAELPQLGSKAEWFRDGFRIMKEPKFSRLKAIVYWHERWQNSDGENAGKYSNLRVNSSPEALEAYRRGVSDPFYLGSPLWEGK